MSTRMMRWVFSRAGEVMECELTLDPAAFAYELAVRRSGPPASAFSERFGDVSRAFERQCELESTLLKDGWSLTSYEPNAAVSASL